MANLCAVADCNGAVLARGWCRKHYNRWQAHGDPQVCLLEKAPNGAPEAFLLAVLSSQTDECILWPYGKNGAGYGSLQVGDSKVLAHREVCTHVYGPAPSSKHDAAHDNNGSPCVSRACVNPRHLRWATRSENKMDCVAHDTHHRGERAGGAKLTNLEASEILSLRGRMSQRQLARKYGVHQTTISDIHTGRRWSWMREGA